jgi:dTDP-4-dehydrorhamnose 3,5-epimerase
MIFKEADICGAYLIDIEKHPDERGFFARTWCREEFRSHGLASDFAQNSVSYNRTAGTLRGLHYQWHPHCEAKLVQCVRGAIFDVILDLRPNSQSFGRWLGVELTAESHRMLYIPEQFAHGFQTLESDTEVSYMISALHHPGAGRGIRYNDPFLGIPWPKPVTCISVADESWLTLDQQPDIRPANADLELSPR